MQAVGIHWCHIQLCRAHKCPYSSTKLASSCICFASCTLRLPAFEDQLTCSSSIANGYCITPTTLVSTKLHINAQEADAGTDREALNPKPCVNVLFDPQYDSHSANGSGRLVCSVEFKTRVMHT